MGKADKHFIGIGFWIGGGVFSIINIFKILTHSSILNYDYIMTGIAVIFIILCLILMGKKKKIGDTGNIKDKYKYETGYKYGIGFWIGGGVYSLINMIMNVKNALQSDILFYNYLISGVAVIGLILNVFLLIKGQNKEE